MYLSLPCTSSRLASMLSVYTPSVVLGNPGQVSYVAANSFLDALASYRTLLNPSIRSLSLQLGAWESRLIDGMQFDDEPMRPITHRDGIPLLLRAFDGSRSVQILADLRPEKMRHMSCYSQDPYFADFLYKDSMTSPTTTASTTSLTHMAVENIVSAVLRDVLEMSSHETLGGYLVQAPFTIY